MEQVANPNDVIDLMNEPDEDEVNASDGEQSAHIDGLSAGAGDDRISGDDDKASLSLELLTWWDQVKQVARFRDGKALNATISPSTLLGKIFLVADDGMNIGCVLPL